MSSSAVESKPAAAPVAAAEERRDPVRADGERKGDRKGDRKGPRDAEPKYNDTPEAAEQMKHIKDIEQKMKDVQQKLSQLVTKGKEIERKVNLTLKDKSKAEERVELLKKRIEKIKAERSELTNAVKAARDVVEQRRAAEAKAKNGLVKKKKLQTDEEFINSCLADIERRVKELNAELEASAGSVSDERRLLKEVQRVRATKSQIPIYLQRSKALQEARIVEKRAERDLESKDSFIKTLEAELEDLRAEIGGLAGGETKPVKEALTTEEQQLTEQLNKLYADLRASKDGLNANREKWYEARREKVRKQAEKQQARRDEERTRRQLEQRERAIAERAERKSVQPHGKEIADLTSLLQYLDGLLEAETKANAAPVTAAAPAAAAPVAAAAKAEEDDWGAFAAKNKKTKAKAPQAAAPKKKGAKFVVNLQSMDQFSKQGFTAPMTLEAVPATRAAVKAKLDALVLKAEAEIKVIQEQIAKEEAEEARLVEKEKAEAAARAAAAAPAEAAKAEPVKAEPVKVEPAKEEKKAEPAKDEKKPAAAKEKAGKKK